MKNREGSEKERSEKWVKKGVGEGKKKGKKARPTNVERLVRARPCGQDE